MVSVWVVNEVGEQVMIPLPQLLVTKIDEGILNNDAKGANLSSNDEIEISVSYNWSLGKILQLTTV